MIRCMSAGATLLLVGVVSFATQTIHADIVQNNVHNDSQSFFDSNISSIDLIQSGAPTLLGDVVSSKPGIFSEFGANDGNALLTSGLSYWNGDNSSGIELTFTLAGSHRGYNIETVNSVFGWGDSRYRHAAQQWTLLVTTVDNPVFTPLHSVEYQPYAANDNAEGASQVTLSDTSGTIATGVTALRFFLEPYSSFGQPGYTGEVGILREFDVFGRPTPVPEPSCIAVLGIAGILLTSRRRR